MTRPHRFSPDVPRSLRQYVNLYLDPDTEEVRMSRLRSHRQSLTAVFLGVIVILMSGCARPSEEPLPRNQALYLEMRDGVRIAVDVWLPEGVSGADRRAMLDVLETWVEVKNAGTRNEVRNSERATFYRDQAQQSYRKWELHVWELSGSEETWEQQLFEHYAH